MRSIALSVAASAAALAFSTISARADIRFYGVFYAELFEQSSDAPPASPAAFTFSARVIPDLPEELAAASFTLPGASAPIDLPRLNPSLFEFSAPATGRDQLAMRFPAGAFAFEISGGTLGVQTAELLRPGFYFTSAVPAFSDSTVSRLKTGDTTVDQTVTFTGFTPGVGADSGLVSFELVSEETGARIQNDVVGADATSVIIPAGSLVQGGRYRATLTYSSRTELFGQGFSAVSIVACDRITTLRFAPGGRPTGPDFNGDGQVDMADLNEYIACFFDPACDRADYSNDGFTDPDDLADFIAAIFGPT